MKIKFIEIYKVLCIVLMFIMLISIVASCNYKIPQPEEIPVPSAPDDETTLPDGEETNIEDNIFCRCEQPEGTLAPQNTTASQNINTTTPGDTLVVGTPPMQGDFVQGWGSNSYDEAVKTLTGGYRDTYTVSPDGQIYLNESVVCKLETSYDEQWNKTYTFTLHSHLKWNNGEPLTARDFVAGILTYASYAFAETGGMSDTGAGILGYETYHTMPGAPYFEGITLIDEYSFSATIEASKLPYFWETSYLIFRPVCMQLWFPENEIESNNYGSRFVFPIREDLEKIYETERYAPTVTCGPYRFVSYDGQTVRLERNEYFGVCAEGYIPYFDYIIQTVIPADKAEEMLWTGEIDYAPGIDIETANGFNSGEIIIGEIPGEAGGEEGEPADPPRPVINIRTHTYPRAGYGFLEYALDYGATENYNVRLAIAHIIDREILIEQAFSGNAVTVDGAYSPAQWTYIMRQNELESGLMQKNYDPAEANRLLDETGWIYEEDGETPFDTGLTSIDGLYLRHNAEGEVLHITVAVGSERFADALENSARMNASLAGIKFTVEITDFPTLLEYYHNGKLLPPEERRWNAFGLAVDFTPVDDKFWSYHSSLAETPLNTNGVSDELLDEIIMEMRSLEPEQIQEYADLWVAFQVRRQELLPAFPLYVNRCTDGMSTIVTQVPTTAFAPYQDVIMHIAKYE